MCASIVLQNIQPELNYSCRHLSRAKVVKIVTKLTTDTRFKKLSLWRSCLDSPGLLEITHALKINTSLLVLDITSCGLNSDKAAFIATALEANNTLLSLDISHNDIGLNGAMALAKTLEKNTSLTHLSCKQNNIGNAGISLIASALKINSSLLELNLASNRVYSGTAPIPETGIGEMLKINSTLQSLCLGYNLLTTVDAISIADALCINNSLTELNISGNINICAEGINAIAQALRINNSLKTMKMLGIRMKNDTYLAINEMLGINNTLQSLEFDINSDTQLKEIVNALQDNHAIIYIHTQTLFDNNRLYDLLSRNRKELAEKRFRTVKPIG